MLVWGGAKCLNTYPLSPDWGESKVDEGVGRGGQEKKIKKRNPTRGTRADLVPKVWKGTTTGGEPGGDLRKG